MTKPLTKPYKTSLPNMNLVEITQLERNTKTKLVAKKIVNATAEKTSKETNVINAMLNFMVGHIVMVPVSYTHLTLPTNREV